MQEELAALTGQVRALTEAVRRLQQICIVIGSYSAGGLRTLTGEDGGPHSVKLEEAWLVGVNEFRGRLGMLGIVAETAKDS